VAVDRVNEGDAVRQPARSATDAVAAAIVDDLDRRALLSRLHRRIADHTYGLASYAWAEVTGDLRAAWDDHKQRYPEQARPAPETTPDGGWAAGPHRRLSPEQHAETAKAYADIADEGRRDILPALKRVESADPARVLAGLENLIKGEDRLKEKVADELAAPGLSERDALAKVSDAVRSTLVYSPQHYADGVCADVELLKAEGFELLKLKNLWSDEQYKGINSQWRRPETGLRFEVQFHTRESLEAKELTHEAYERIRSDTSPTEREDLRQFQRTVNALLITPERTAEIKDYPENEHGREDHLLRNGRRVHEPRQSADSRAPCDERRRDNGRDLLAGSTVGILSADVCGRARRPVERIRPDQRGGGSADRGPDQETGRP
jgi:hypothetical protein